MAFHLFRVWLECEADRQFQVASTDKYTPAPIPRIGERQDGIAIGVHSPGWFQHSCASNMRRARLPLRVRPEA